MERAVLVLAPVCKRDPERIRQRLCAARIKSSIGENGELHIVMRGVQAGLPTTEEITEMLEVIPRKVASVLRQAEPPRRPRRDLPKPSVPPGKYVTVPQDVDPGPKEEPPMAAEDARGEMRERQEAEREELLARQLEEERAALASDYQPVPGEGFAAEIERRTRIEAERVLADLARLRFNAHQVVRVLRALSLEVPPELAALLGGSPQAEWQARDPEPPAPASGAVEAPEREPETTPAKPPQAPSAPPPERERPQPPPESEAGPEPTQKRVPPVGGKEAARAAGEANRAAVLGYLQDHPEGVGLRPIYEALGISQTVVSRHLKTLIAEGLIEKRGQMRAARYYARTTDSLPTPVKAPTREVADDEEPLLGVVRDAVVGRQGDFSPQQVADDLPGDPPVDVITARLRQLAEQGIINDVSPAPDLMLFNYERPKDAGAAAKIDQQRRAGTGPRVVGADAVAGTGNGKLSSNAEVNEVVRKVRAQGATATKGGSHIQIRYGGRTVTIGTTPGKVGFMKDKEKIRKVLGLAV